MSAEAVAWLVFAFTWAAFVIGGVLALWWWDEGRGSRQ